jgi:hypothetical protein
MQATTDTIKKTAKQLAKEISAFLATPSKAIADDKPLLNYVDLLWLGSFVNEALIAFGIMPPISAVVTGDGELQPARLEHELYKRILAKGLDESVENFRRDVRRIRELIAERRGLRGLHIQLVRAVVPAAPRGRSRKIARNQLAELAKLADQLLPVMRTFLEVQKHAPKTNPLRTLEYLREQHQGPSLEYLLQRSSRLEREFRRMAKVGTAVSKARYLADVLAGDRWGLSASYSVKMCKETRGKKLHS